jgi:glycosyltransferase involved in cell wall biosynthesis
LIDSSVEWVGTTPDVSRYLTSSTALILASKYEGFGLVLLEAMCANIPIFASNTSAIPEVLGVDHPGLFEVGNIDALASLLEESRNNAAMRKIVKSQNRRLKIFSSESMMDSMESLYSKICSVNT